jgi:hypothetical protein
MKLGTNTISTVKLGTNQVQKVYLGTNEVWANTDPDYQAILDYATTQGYTLPSVGQQALQNQLVVDLKAAGVWSKLDTFAVFATDGNSDFALIDWIRLTQYTAVNSPTFTTNGGFNGNGTSSYIDTNFNPATSGVNYTLNDASRIMWGVFPADITYPESSNGSNTNFTRNFNENNRQQINQSGYLLTGLSPSTWAGSGDRLRSISRTSSTNIEMFGNTTQSSGTSTSTSLNTTNQFILRGNSAYAPSTNIFKIYGMGASLVSENTDLYNALNTYITSL